MSNETPSMEDMEKWLQEGYTSGASNSPLPRAEQITEEESVGGVAGYVGDDLENTDSTTTEEDDTEGYEVVDDDTTDDDSVENTEEGNKGDKKSPKQTQEVNQDPWAFVLGSLDEEKRKAAEELLKQRENDHKAAVGRVAFLQRQFAQMQKATANGVKQDNVPSFTLPEVNSEEWNALKKADPEVAKAMEAYMRTTTEALRQGIEKQYAPLIERDRQRQEFEVAQRQAEDQMVYEAFPEVENIVQSQAWKDWVNWYDQSYPGFKSKVESTTKAYGTQNEPGVVNYLQQFMEDYQRATSNQSQQTVVNPEQQAKASAVQAQRNTKIKQAAPAKPRTPLAGGTDNSFDPEAELLASFDKQMGRLGGGR